MLWQKIILDKNKKQNNELVELIKVRWSNLKDEIENMSEDEKKKKIGKPDKILKIVTGNNSEKLKSKIRQLLYSLQIKKTYKATL